MNFSEKISALTQKLNAKLTAESSPEQIEEINSLVAEVNALNEDYSHLEQEHAKTKDALVRMVVTQGNSDKPKEDESGGSNPRTIDEIIADKLKEKEAKK